MSIPQSGGGPIESHDQLAEYLASGCKPKEDWRIGTEHEKFGYCRDSLRPIPYEGERSVKAMLEGLRDRYGWDPVHEAGQLIGLTRNGANVSLEPGGQLELSGAPLESIHQTCDEVNEHLREVHAIADEVGVSFIGLGAAPIWKHEDMPVMPKGRYKLMTEYMGRVGTSGTQMMYRTCTVQVNLDFASEADMVQKFRVALALQPVATALFANSPFKDGAPSGWLSTRAQAWTDTDAARSGVPACVFDDYFGYEQWIDYILDVPMYFLHRGDDYIDVAGRSFRDFMDGMLTGFEGQMPSMADFQDHITTAFPEVRLKRFLEMRGADGGAWGNICALPAFWVGLLYDEEALEEATALAAPLGADDVMAARLSVARDGLRGQLGGRDVHDLAARLVELASAGLRRRARIDDSGGDETGYLAPLRNALASGETPAERLLRLYRDSWDGDLARIFEAERYS